MNLRPYQAEAVEATLRELAHWTSTLNVLPTGAGKTVIFSHLIKHFSKRVMIIAHRQELVAQAAEKVCLVTGIAPDVEMGEHWAHTGLLGKAKVIVSSVQTQSSRARGRGRMCRFDPAEFDLVILDEAHHATSASWLEVVEHYRQNSKCKIVGFTATPDRADQQALGRIFESVAFKYEFEQAIADGYLVPIRQTAVFVEALDFSRIRTTAGDLNGTELAEVMEYEENLHGIATPTFELSRGRKTLIFASSREHGKRLAEILNRHESGCAAFVDCETASDVRKRLFDSYHGGEFRFLVNVGIASEGWDGPTVEVIVVARPTKSRSLYAQMIGRGTRPLSGVVDRYEHAAARCTAIATSAKPYMEVIDFMGNAGRHNLVTTADILGGDYSAAALKRVKAAQQQGQVSADVISELRKAEAAIRREDEEQIAQERRKMIVGTACYTTAACDPFDVLDLIPKKAQGWDRAKSLSDKQSSFLQTRGIDPRGMTYTSASQLIGELKKRQDNGQCTFKQAKLLRKYGYSPDVTFVEAKRIIDSIAASGWQRPVGEAV